MLIFRLDERSGIPMYRQLVDQVRHAVTLGYLTDGDQLPTVRDVAATLAINPNTVAKAYHELEWAGLAAPRPGLGTFVTAAAVSQAGDHARLRASLTRWLRSAHAAGLTVEQVRALVTDVTGAHPREAVSGESGVA